MKEVSAYKCEFCNMVSIYKASVARHEKYYCKKSPERKCCGLCVHAINEPLTVYNPNHGGYPGSTDYEVDNWYCEDLDRDLDGCELNDNNECECFISKTIAEVRHV